MNTNIKYSISECVSIHKNELLRNCLSNSANDNHSLKKSTLNLYNRVLDKIEVTSIIDLHDHDVIISRINALSSNSYKIMAYRAINCIMSDFIYQNEYRKLVTLQYSKEQSENIHSLPITLNDLLNIEVKCENKLQQLVESFTIWINTHYPLRLDYYNVKINDYNTEEKENSNENYMTYLDNKLTFYLNDFKTSGQILAYFKKIL